LTYLKPVSDWKSFAAYVLPPDGVSTEIDVIDGKYRGDVEECKIALYNTYIHKGEVSWAKIAEALEKSSHSNIAKIIKTDFDL